MDRFATGLLVVLTGTLTRLNRFFSGMDKSYRATIYLGKSTATLDPEGDVVDEKPVPTLRMIEKAVEQLTGAIEQVPPDYAAIHINGERAYKMIRKGTKPAMKPREVTIHRLELLNYNPPYLVIEVDCSKGTYIRALARDLGLMADSCAYVCSLERTQVGPFRLTEAVRPDDFSATRDIIPPIRFVPEIEGLRPLTVLREAVSMIRTGQVPGTNLYQQAMPENGVCALFDPEGQLLAIVSISDGHLSYEAVLIQ